MTFTGLSKGDYIIFIPAYPSIHSNIKVYKIGNVHEESVYTKKSNYNISYNVTFRAIELDKELKDIDDIKTIKLESVSPRASIAYQDGGRYELIHERDKGKEKELIQLLFDIMKRNAVSDAEAEVRRLQMELEGCQRRLNDLKSVDCPQYKEFEEKEKEMTD